MSAGIFDTILEQLGILTANMDNEGRMLGRTVVGFYRFTLGLVERSIKKVNKAFEQRILTVY